MNSDENILKRLLKVAVKSPRQTPVSIPFALEARILAEWRSATPEKDLSWLAGSLRSAVICAVLIVVVSIGWSQFTNAHEVPGAQALSNLAQAAQIIP